MSISFDKNKRRDTVILLTASHGYVDFLRNWVWIHRAHIHITPASHPHHFRITYASHPHHIYLTPSSHPQIAHAAALGFDRYLIIAEDKATFDELYDDMLLRLKGHVLYSTPQQMLQDEGQVARCHACLASP